MHSMLAGASKNCFTGQGNTEEVELPLSLVGTKSHGTQPEWIRFTSTQPFPPSPSHALQRSDVE